MIQRANILLMIDSYIVKPVVIGTDLEGLSIYRITLQQYLVRELRGIGGIEIESHEESKEYGLMIMLCQGNKRQCEYYLLEFASPYDVIRLGRRVETLKKEKNWLKNSSIVGNHQKKKKGVKFWQPLSLEQ